MKLWKVFFIALLFFSALVFTASGRNGFTGMIYIAENNASGRLAEKSMKKLADDYIEYIDCIGYEPKYIYIEYLGKYDGCELAAIEIQSSYSPNVIQITDIAGYAFVSASPREIFLHKDGTFIDIAAAYDLGYLKYEDIGKAHQIFLSMKNVDPFDTDN